MALDSKKGSMGHGGECIQGGGDEEVEEGVIHNLPRKE